MNESEVTKVELVSVQYAFSIVTFANTVNKGFVKQKDYEDYIDSLITDEEVIREIGEDGECYHKIADSLASYIAATVMQYSNLDREDPTVSYEPKKGVSKEMMSRVGKIVYGIVDKALKNEYEEEVDLKDSLF